MPDRRPITSTYRLQLHAGFGFAAAEAAVSYLAKLGVSHLYLSPVLQAAPGSMHGYDVVDHSAISAELGGRAALESLAQSAHRHDLGLVVDVVPNHMAVPTPLTLNRQLWSVLREGRDSPAADWFDIDWDLCNGRVGLPVLGEPLGEAIAAGNLTWSDNPGAEPVLRYYEQVFPVRPGTRPGGLRDVLDQQHYLLASWRDKDTVLGYRRFFDVDTLIAVRVEDDDVFDATHRLLIDLHDGGVMDGFRIDHPDGLADPEGYLDRLRDATAGAWVVVEKILASGEELPETWSCAGTTGYDAISAIQAALVPSTAADLDDLWQQVTAEEPPSLGLAALNTTETRAKDDVILGLLQPEVHRLARRAVEAAGAIGAELAAADARQAIETMLRHVQTYRAYLRLGVEPSADAVASIGALARLARADRPDLGRTVDLVERLLLDTDAESIPGRDLVIRFQQVCGPVMAKGVEDTTFYRWHRFIALNEVGGDPLSLDRGDPRLVHAWAARQQRRRPFGLTALSTHDTKRDEDVRARLLAAGEQTSRWNLVWAQARQLATVQGVDLPTAYLLMQSLVGAWPIAEERLTSYAEKAIREAKVYTTWTDPDPHYEQRVASFARSAVSDGSLSRAVAAWTADLASAVRSVRLSAKLVQLTLPGVPDVYQGTELVQGFLVDPDNRRPVDFEKRERLLHDLDGTADCSDDELKLAVVSRTLRLRRSRPELFGRDADYAPLDSSSEYAWGFLRGDAVATLVQRQPSRLVAADGFGEASISVPNGHWVDVLTGRPHSSPSSDPGVRCSDVYAALPVALLLRETT